MTTPQTLFSAGKEIQNNFFRIWIESIKLEESIVNKNKAREERIWIENNPHIHLLNYPYYKLKRWIGKKLK